MIALADSFPLQLPGARLEILDDDTIPAFAKPGEQWLTVRLIRFDYNESITDIMEQSICIARAPAMLDNQERVRNCVAAHRELLTEVFERDRDHAQSLMPCDLLFVHELLALTKAFTIEDFTRALLAKKRLGRLVRRS